MLRIWTKAFIFPVFAVALTLLALRVAAAQGLVTDRPDFTESAVAVPVGSAQFEGGGTYSSLGNDHSEFTAGEAFVRWGLREKVEIRFGAPSFVLVSNGSSTSGLSDGSIGAKVQIGPLESGWDLALIGSLSLPIGDDEFSSEEVDPTVILTTGRALDDKFSIGGQVAASWPTEGEDRVFEWGGTVVLGAAVGPGTGAFLELAVTVPEDGTAPLTGHTGLIHALSETFQVDVHGGIGLSDTAPDVFVGVGLATRLVSP
jgi:hypothetical protein